MSENTLTFFTDENALKTLTGLSGSELYAAGFPHRNWTWGFVSDVPYVRHVVADEDEDTYGYTEFRYIFTRKDGYKNNEQLSKSQRTTSRSIQ